MGEKREGLHISKIKESNEAEVMVKPRALELMDRVKAAREALKVVLQKAEFKEGREAIMRTTLNALISVADTVPGVGDMVSWGADIAKILARVEYKRQRELLELAGKDPSVVRMSKFELTPDVSVKIAVFTEFLEPFFLGFLPSHTIESSFQFYADFPKLKAMALELRKVYKDSMEVSTEERVAINHFKD